MPFLCPFRRISNINNTSFVLYAWPIETIRDYIPVRLFKYNFLVRHKDCATFIFHLERTCLFRKNQHLKTWLVESKTEFHLKNKISFCRVIWSRKYMNSLGVIYLLGPQARLHSLRKKKWKLFIEKFL